MAAFTASVTGDWNDTATWGGAGIPVSGDTVTIANGVTLTVPAGYTAVCGTSPTSDAGAVALQCASSTGTGILVVNGTLQWQGPVRQANATWTVGAGGTLTYDASGAGTPATALYSWSISQASSQANAKLVFNGTSGSRCTVNSVGNVQSGGFGNTVAANSGGGRLEASYTDFAHHGAATTTGNFLIFRFAGTESCILDHCTLTSCAQVQSTHALPGGATFRVKNTAIATPVNSNFTFQLICTTALAAGVREILNSEWAGRCYLLCTGGVASGFTFKHNVGRVYDPTATNPRGPLEVTTGGGVSAFEQNLFFLNAPTTGDPTIGLGYGDLLDCYCVRQCNPSHANCHPIYVRFDGGNASIDGWVHHYFGAETNSDWVNLNTDPTVDRTLTVTGCVYLPNAIGTVAGSLVNQQGAVTQDNGKIRFDHNTVAIGSGTGNVVLGVGAEAGAVWPAGTVPSIRSNLAWRYTSGTGLIANSHNTATVNNSAVTDADYNWTYNVTGSLYGVPSGQFAVTPGAHDGTGDPQFVDAARSILNFDQGYLGNPVATAWANATAYAVGDTVSASTSTFFGGATYNYRCIVAHTSATATDKPGSGSAWAAKWEPAAVKLIADDVLAGTTYEGGTNSLIGELVAWVKAGFVVQNATARTASHTGTVVGAVQDAVPASGYTLTADAGSFTLTGTAAALEYGRTVTAAAGSVAVTGTAASLEYGRVMPADAGAVTVTGSSAGLQYSGDAARLDAQAGAVALTGTAAALLYGRRMPAAAGDVTIAGTAVTLKADRELSASAGSYAVTGLAATLRYSAAADTVTSPFQSRVFSSRVFAT